MTIKNFLSANEKFFDKKDLEIFLEKILECDKNFLFLNENFSIPEKKFLELENFLEEKNINTPKPIGFFQKDSFLFSNSFSVASSSVSPNTMAF